MSYFFELKVRLNTVLILIENKYVIKFIYKLH